LHDNRKRKVIKDKSTYILETFSHLNKLSLIHRKHVRRSIRQAKALCEHRRYTKYSSPNTISQISQSSSPSHSNLASFCGKPNSQEIFFPASTIIQLLQLLLIEEHSQKGARVSTRCCQQAHSVPGYPDCTLRDTDWESGWVLWYTYED